MTATGEVGNVVRVTVGIHNKGSDRLRWKGINSAVEVTWKFTLPPGTDTVPSPAGERPPYGYGGNLPAPDVCWNQTGESLMGPGPYLCWTKKIFEAGASSQVTFYLKITKMIPNATGTVEVTGRPDSANDSDPDNDKAFVVINPR
jgi:hypothetical protein